MPVDTNYFYSGRIYKLIKQTLRIFSGYQISVGIDEETGQDILRNVPVLYMSSDKSALALLNKGSDAILQTLPKMILALTSVSANYNYNSGAAYEENEIAVTERKWDEEQNKYVDEIGNTYNITQLNPVPVGLTFTLYVITTTINQKLQLFEQIRAIFARGIELQTSENPFDMCRLSTLRLDNINWSSRGTSGLDSTQADSMDLIFKVDTYLDMPALITHKKIIEKIVTDIKTSEKSIDDLPSLSVEDMHRIYHTPNKLRLNVYYDEENNQQIAEIITAGYDNVNTWYDVFSLCHIKYNQNEPNVYLHCTSTANLTNTFEYSGLIEVISSDPTKAIFTINPDTLPKENIQPVTNIIDPHTFKKADVQNTRYLLAESINKTTNLFGTIRAMDGKEYPFDQINSQSIIEFKNEFWFVMLDPVVSPSEYYLRNSSEPHYLYTFNTEYNAWVDAINKKYSPLLWKLSQKN